MRDENAPKLLPGIAAIGLWMFLLSVFVLVGVTRHHLPLLFLLFFLAFAMAGQGLLRLRRWGWALSLAAVLLTATYEIWFVAKTHELGLIVMAGLNLVFFLYLVRPEVRERLR
ncbi:MAG TPA: hypothetical protein VHX37_18320 [Acidobacteriaceae bacterium]|jgi:hypothetical protein|nr:hypothetical protein [Acidobacteriaceae bacterium]